MAVEVLRYHDGEVIEVGDRVMEPVNGGKRVGTVTEVLQPGADPARAAGHPHGGISVEWDGDPTSYFFPPHAIAIPDLLFLLDRKA